MRGFEHHKIGRQLAFQFLFGVKYYSMDWPLALEPFWEMKPLALSQEITGETNPTVSTAGGEISEENPARIFAEQLISGVMEHLQELDDHIAVSLDNWKPERVGRAEWTLLRLAIYELLYCPETPNVAVIAEAVRLTDLFGDYESARFVNGILNRFSQNRSDTAG